MKKVVTLVSVLVVALVLMVVSYNVGRHSYYLEIMEDGLPYEMEEKIEDNVEADLMMYLQGSLLVMPGDDGYMDLRYYYLIGEDAIELNRIQFLEMERCYYTVSVIDD